MPTWTFVLLVRNEGGAMLSKPIAVLAAATAVMAGAAEIRPVLADLKARTR